MTYTFWFKVHIAALVALSAIVFVLASFAIVTHHSLCSFKDDLERRIVTTEEFLEQHPDGVAGITRADFERSLAGQRATLDSIGDLYCW